VIADLDTPTGSGPAVAPFPSSLPHSGTSRNSRPDHPQTAAMADWPDNPVQDLDTQPPPADSGTPSLDRDLPPTSPDLFPNIRAASLILETTGLSSHRPDVQIATGKTPRQLESRLALEALTQTVVHKLDTVGRVDLSAQISGCSKEWTIRHCTGCRATTTFLNHCDKFFCPNCQPRLAKLRRQGIEWWTNIIQQPKHVVLTCRNTFQLDRAYIGAVKKAFGQLRRSKFASNWKGGCWTLEVTNEGRGWHVHIHALVDARFIDSSKLAVEWGKRVHQDFAIVKVKDCRGRDYLKEVTKYAVKGNELAGWTGAEIAAFVDAMSEGRNFGTFGTLYARNADWRQWLSEVKDSHSKCPCGCDQFRYFSPNEWEAYALRFETGPPRVINTTPNPQLVFDVK